MKIRHIWSYALGILFLISIPLALLYTAGYEFNFQRVKFVHTGTLSVNSRPTGARVAVDGVVLPGATPTRAPRLSEGIYEVAVAKPGYHEWKKLLEVQSGRTTLAENVNLYPYALPERIVSGIITNIAPTPDGTRMLIVRRDARRLSVSILTLASNAETTIPTNAGIAWDAAKWSTDNPGVLETTVASSTTIINPNSGRIISKGTAQVPKTILATDGVEVTITDTAKKTTLLITRLGAGVNDAIWNDDKTSVFVASGGNLLAIELDDRDRRIATALATMDEIKKIALAPDGKTLYLAGRIGSESGLYRLRVR